MGSSFLFPIPYSLFPACGTWFATIRERNRAIILKMLGGFAATLLKLGMTKHWWIGGWKSRAVVCLGAALWVGTAMASPHPVRYAEATVAHHGPRRVIEHAATPKAKAGKNSARKTKSRATAPAAKASPKAGHRKRHRTAEADNDPPLIYRTGARTKTPVRGDRPKPIAGDCGAARIRCRDAGFRGRSTRNE